MARPRWVFFDVGNTLVSDEYAMATIYRMIAEAVQRSQPAITLADILAEREALITEEGDSQPHWTIAVRYFGAEGWAYLHSTILSELDHHYLHYHRPAPGAEQVLDRLAREYRLGVGANQVPACREALELFGLLKHLSVVWLSDEVGLRKPSPEFFYGMLQEAGCRPDEAVMIGDRIDFDIRPAKEIGMRTIHARYSTEFPADNHDKAARLYYESLGRARVAEIRAGSPDEVPDVTVTALEKIPAAVRSFG